MAICGDLERLRVGVEGCDSFAQPRNQGCFVLGAENTEAAVLTNLGPLVTLRALAPLLFGVRFLRRAGLSCEMCHDASGNVFAAIRKAPIELESFKQDGETEAGGAGLVADQFALFGGERPMLNEFVRVPVFHGLLLATFNSNVRRRSIPRTFQAYSGAGPTQNRLFNWAKFVVIRKKRTRCGYIARRRVGTQIGHQATHAKVFCAQEPIEVCRKRQQP